MADVGTLDDYDVTYLNGVELGSVSPKNLDRPEEGWSVRRVYPIRDGLLKPGATNVLAIYTWNRNADAKGWKAYVRGPITIRPRDPGRAPHAGQYKPSDDPYLERHW